MELGVGVAGLAHAHTLPSSLPPTLVTLLLVLVRGAFGVLRRVPGASYLHSPAFLLFPLFGSPAGVQFPLVPSSRESPLAEGGRASDHSRSAALGRVQLTLEKFINLPCLLVTAQRLSAA